MNTVTNGKDSRKHLLAIIASLLACFALVMALVPVQITAAAAEEPSTEQGPGNEEGGEGEGGGETPAPPQGNEDEELPSDPSQDPVRVPVPAALTNLTFNGSALKLLSKNEGYDIKVNAKSPNQQVDMDSNNDYVLGTEAGDYVFDIEPKSGYIWESGGTDKIERTVKVAPRELSKDEVTITCSKNVTLLDGAEAAVPDVSATLVSGPKLVPGVDYKLEVLDNKAVGDEGSAIIRYEGNYSGTSPVQKFKVVAPQKCYRLYCPVNYEHLYTIDEVEYKYLKEHGWDDEDVAWVSPEESAIPVYRLYNPITRQHLYTTDENERKVLSKERGWNDEGVKFYSEENAVVPVQRLYKEDLKIHLNTTDQNEVDTLQTRGWKLDNTSFFAAQVGK